METRQTELLYSALVAPRLDESVSLSFAGIGVLGGAIAATQFASKYVTIFQPYPVSITFNTDFLRLMDEDEVLYILLHEGAHVNAGYFAEHGREWAVACEALGVPAYERIAIRRLPEFLDTHGFVEVPAPPTFPETFIPNW